MPSLVRETKPDDIAAITAIYAHYVKTSAATFELEIPGPAEMRRRFEAGRAEGFPHLVAEIDGQVVGFATAGPFRSRAAYQSTVEDTVYVSPAWTGKGAGSALLDALLMRCRELRFAEMVAVIGGENPSSVALHARAGFAHVGVLSRVGRKFGAWQNVTLMQKGLQPALR